MSLLSLPNGIIYLILRRLLKEGKLTRSSYLLQTCRALYIFFNRHALSILTKKITETLHKEHPVVLRLPIIEKKIPLLKPIFFNNIKEDSDISNKFCNPNYTAKGANLPEINNKVKSSIINSDLNLLWLILYLHGNTLRANYYYRFGNIAIEKNNLLALKILIQYDFLTHPTNGLIYCIEHNYTNMAKFLIKKVADVNYHTPNGNLLHCAINYENQGILQLLINAGANINFQDKRGQTPLHLAVIKNNTKAIKLLIQAGADKNIVDIKDSTPLSLALYHNYDQAIFLLYKKKEDNHMPTNCGAKKSVSDLTKFFEFRIDQPSI